MDDLELRVQHRERQIAAMQRVSDALFSHLDVDALVRETLRVATEVLGVEGGTVMLHRPEGDCLEFCHVLGPMKDRLSGYRMPVSQGIAGRVFRTGEPDVSHDVRKSPGFNPDVDDATGFTTISMMTVALKRSEGPPIGVMQVVNAMERSFTPSDLEVLQVLAAQAASAIERARLADEARRAEIVNVLGDISHDVKNMLTPIQTGIWTVMPMFDDLLQAADAIQNPTDEMAPLVQALNGMRDRVPWILDLCIQTAEAMQSRTREIADAIKGEMSPPHFEVASLNDTAREVHAVLEMVAGEAKVALTLELDPDLPRMRFDRRQMYHALYNLVNNAIPETPEGGCVVIRTQRVKGEVRVEVEDNGKGMRPDIRDSLFTERCRSTKQGGTGLGTRIVANIVRRHGGTIDVDSEPGRGSRFTIHLSA